MRNITETAPYGHSGAHATLADFITYHTDPQAGLETYQMQAILPGGEPEKPDLAALDDPAERAAIAAAVTTDPVMLSDAEVAQIVIFLQSLRDPASIEGRLGIPDVVPSGLPVDH